MAEIQHPYNEAEIARIRRQLELATKSNNPQAFEINVDGYRHLHRTTSLEQFDEGMNMLPEDFEVVEVKIFYGGANMNDNHQFLRNYSSPVQQQQQTQQQQQYTQQGQQQNMGQNLSGSQQAYPSQNLDWVDQRVKQSIEAERAKWTTEQLEKENASLKAELKQKEEYIGKLENFALNSNKGFSWDQLEGVVSTGLRMYGQYQANKQGNLSGAPQPQPQQQTNSTTDDAEYEQEEEVSEFEKHLRALVEQVNATFNPFQAKVFIDLLEEAVLHPHLLPEILKFLRARVYQRRNPNRRRQNRNGQHYQQQTGQQQQPFTVSHSQSTSDDMNDHDEDDHNQTN